MSRKKSLTFLDGPLGTELNARGVPTPLPAWSATAIETHPEVIRAIHADYAHAGATVHTACTFRTRPATSGERWSDLARAAVALCRQAVPSDHRVAGSIAPIADCYRPDLSPPSPGPQHQALAEVLVDAGADLLLCETFPHPGEALAAVDAAVRTGRETWLALTAGPDGELLSPQALADTARAAVDHGASAILVNCVATPITLAWVEALGQADLPVPFGAYANAGHPDDQIGWRAGPPGPERYLHHARTWVAAGATLIGACCGTTPQHIRAMSNALAHAN